MDLRPHSTRSTLWIRAAAQRGAVGVGAAGADSAPDPEPEPEEDIEEEEEEPNSDLSLSQFFSSDDEDDVDEMMYEGELSPANDDQGTPNDTPADTQQSDEDEDTEFEIDNDDDDSDVQVILDEDDDGLSDILGSGNVVPYLADDSDANSNQSAFLTQRDQDEEVEISSPPRKQAKIDHEQAANAPAAAATSKPVEDDGESDGQTCTICYDTFTNSGDHRISCLRCGHVYGKMCIEKWLKIHGRCPQCNCKATKKDIRVLYVKSVQAVDNTELVQARKELSNMQTKLSRSTLENAKLLIQVDCLKQKIKRLESTSYEKEKNFTLMRSSTSNPGPSSTVTSATAAAASSLLVPAVPSSPIRGSGRKELSYTFLKHFEIKEGICRVGAYNEWHNMLIITHDMKNHLYPNGAGGIKEINLAHMRPLTSMAIHQKQIRDVQFSLCQNDVLLSVGMDKKAILFNVTGNVGVQTFVTDYPLWSCCWNEVQTHLFYVGTSNGQIITYDIRSPQEPVATFNLEGQDHSPINRMRFVKHAYQSNSFNLCGILVQKLNSISFCEIRDGNGIEFRCHPLPLEGPFTNVDFEPVSRHMLVSTRPSSRALTNSSDFQGSSHHFCDLNQFYSEAAERTVVSAHTIKTFQGSTREVQKLCRSTLFSTEPNYVFVGANGTANAVKYWDVSLPESQHKTICPSPEFVLDFVHGKLNGNDFLTLVNEKGVRVFKQNLA